MKAIGIIAEYNPFHNGHLYHLNTIKKHYKDYKIVLILNGNFTERGDVSIIDKWKRTEIALKEGDSINVVVSKGPKPAEQPSTDNSTGDTDSGDTNNSGTNSGSTNSGGTNNGATNNGGTNSGTNSGGDANAGGTNNSGTNTGGNNEEVVHPGEPTNISITETP